MLKRKLSGLDVSIDRSVMLCKTENLGSNNSVNNSITFIYPL